MYIPDNLDSYERYQSAQDKWLESRPICVECGEHIQEEHYFEINDEPVCFECLVNNHRKRTEDYIA